MADINEIKNLILNTKDHTPEFDSADIEKNRLLSLFAYLGPFILIPFLAAKDSKFAHYHVKQGLVLFIAALILGIVDSLLGGIFLLGTIIHIVCVILGLAILALAILGIYYAVTGKAKDLPLISKVNLIK